MSTPFNQEDISDEDMALFADVLRRLTTSPEGPCEFFAVLLSEHVGTKERREIHIHAHDAVLCEMRRLEEIDKTVGEHG